MKKLLVILSVSLFASCSKDLTVEPTTSSKVYDWVIEYTNTPERIFVIQLPIPAIGDIKLTGTTMIFTAGKNCPISTRNASVLNNGIGDGVYNLRIISKLEVTCPK